MGSISRKPFNRRVRDLIAMCVWCVSGISIHNDGPQCREGGISREPFNRKRGCCVYHGDRMCLFAVSVMCLICIPFTIVSPKKTAGVEWAAPVENYSLWCVPFECEWCVFVLNVSNA